MKPFLCLAACLLAAATALADDRPSFLIESRFENFDPALLKGADATPRVTTKAGQQATIETFAEVPVPLPGGTENGRQPVHSGVTLEVSPEYRDGKITLTGRSTIRHRLEPGEKQPLDAVSFSTRETYFSGEVSDHAPLVIHVGETPADKGTITLTVTRVKVKVVDHEEKHAGPPTYRIYALEPSPADAKQPFFQALGLAPADAPEAKDASFLDRALRDAPFAIAGIIAPEDWEKGQNQAEVRRLVQDSLKLIPADEVPIKLSSVLGPDGQTLDVKIESAAKGMHAFTTDVSVYWGSDIFLTVADAGQPASRHGLLIRQE